MCKKHQKLNNGITPSSAPMYNETCRSRIGLLSNVRTYNEWHMANLHNVFIVDRTLGIIDIAPQTHPLTHPPPCPAPWHSLNSHSLCPTLYISPFLYITSHHVAILQNTIQNKLVNILFTLMYYYYIMLSCLEHPGRVHAEVAVACMLNAPAVIVKWYWIIIAHS